MEFGYEIDRMINGLNIFKIYKQNPLIIPKNNTNWLIEIQEEEFSSITDDDIAALNSYGWIAETKILWKMLTDQGLAKRYDND